MESGPEFRVVGGAKDETVEKVMTEIDSAFSDNEGPISEKLRTFALKHEIEKSPEVKEVVRYANEYTNGLLLRHGIEPYDIPEENIHILNSQDYAQLERASGAFAQPLPQMILINAKQSLTKTQAALTIIHEMFHLKAHKAIQIEDNEKYGRLVSNYRNGVAVESSQSAENSHAHFEGLNEAIVATLETRAIQNTLNQPGFEKEKSRFDDPENQEYLSLLKSKNRETDDITDIRKIGEYWETFITSYPSHRALLKFIVEKIYEDNTDTYESVEDVYQLFIDAHFTGKLLTIARPIEQCFGEGSFRILGDMTTQSDSAKVHLDTFKKLYRKNHN